MEQTAVLIRSKATVKTRRSILEIQGMGKNIKGFAECRESRLFLKYRNRF
jgi:hypothetical protein